MSLFASLNTGLTALQTQMAALQTVGHNIANANTPGFSRQRVELDAMPPHDMVFAQLGKGVRVARIARLVDNVLTGQIRDASSNMSRLNVNQEAMRTMEIVFGELSDADLSTAFSAFFDSIDDLGAHPESASARMAVIENATSLAETIKTMADRLREARQSVNDEVPVIVQNINRIAEEVAQINSRVLSVENGGLDFDAANDLRDRRDLLLKELSTYVGIKVVETSNGAANVLVGSNFIVFDNMATPVATTLTTDRDNLINTPYFTTTGVELELRGGRLKGIVEARDGAMVDIIDSLTTLARSLAFEVNKIHSTGVGLTRFTSLTSVDAVLQPAVSAAPLATNGQVEQFITDTSIRDSSLVGYPADVFNGLTLLVTSGVNAGQMRTVTSFDSATGTLAFESEFDKPLSVGDTFQLTGLKFPIRNGSFEVRVTNELTGQVETFNISVDLDKVLPDSTLSSIAAEINAEVGAAFPSISASVTSTNRLQIRSTSNNTTFSFANDTSNVLAALGMNTLFTGFSASNIGVNELIASNPNLVAAARTNNTGDNSNALTLAGLRTAKVMNSGTTTLENYYEELVGSLAARTAEVNDRVENQSILLEQMENERERISGVNLDEEAVSLIQYQRTFQAAARFINVVDQLLNTLINQM